MRRSSGQAWAGGTLLLLLLLTARAAAPAHGIGSSDPNCPVGEYL